MSGVFGGGGGNSAQQQIYAGIQVSTSIYGQPLPYVAGRQRVPFNLLWYGNFTVSQNSGGGKAGGGGSSTKQYTYSAAFIAGLSLGPIQGAFRVWHDKALVTLSYEGLALSEGGAAFTASISGTVMTVTKIAGGFVSVGGVLANNGVLANTTIVSNGTGSGGTGTYNITPSQTVASGSMRSTQPIWTGYPSGTPTGQKVPYDSQAYIASSAYNLGSSAAMPNITVEIEGTVPGFSNANSIFDADPSAVWSDYLLNQVYGALANYPGTPLIIGSSAAPLQGVTNSYQAWCLANNFMTSPYENTQRQATDFLAELLDCTASTCRLSVGTLELLPYADQPVSATVAGTLYSYTPNLTPVYIFTDDDYCPDKNEEPVTLEIKPQSDTYNMVNILYKDRTNYYNQAPVSCSDQNDIALYGPRVASQLTWNQVTQSTVALKAGQMWLNRQLKEINSYTARVRPDYSLLEPGDYIAHNDAGMGLINQVCQITQIEDDVDASFVITATELPGVTRSLAQYNWNAAQGYFANYAADPGPVQTPYIFVMPPIPASLSEGITLGIAVCGSAANAFWLNYDVYVSVDGGTTYALEGTNVPPATFGTLTAPLSAVADPDTTSTLSVSLANPNTMQISTSVTHAEADSAQTLLLVSTAATFGGGNPAEVMAFGAATLVSAGHYNLSYLRRNMYGSSDEAAGTGAAFVRLDADIFQIAMDPGYAGATIFFKFVSKNLYSQYGNQTLASSTAYSYTLPSAISNNGNLLLTPRGGCTVTGNVVYKQTGVSNAWDSDAYSPQGFLNGAFISFRVSDNTTSVYMVGFVKSIPLGVGDYASLAFAIYPAGNQSSATPPSGRLQIYESGGVAYEGGVAVIAYQPGDSFEIRYDGVTVRYFRNGVLLRAVRAPGLTLFPKVVMGNNGSIVSNLQFGPASSVNQPSGSWINTYPWVVGSVNTQANFVDNFNGTNHDSAIVLGVGPYGTSEALWQTTGAGPNNNGGWNNSGDLYGIDSTKTYRSVVWFQFNGGGVGSGNIYFGCDGNWTNNLAGVQDTNPYFAIVNLTTVAGGGQLVPGRWYLMVGILHGSSYGTTPSGLTGIYDPTTGAKLPSGTYADFKMIANAPYQTQRVYQFYSNNSASVVYFARPRWEEVNGSEPSITTLLSPAGVLAYANNLDQVPNGSVYSRTLAAFVAAGVPFVFAGSYNPATTYVKGNEVTFNGQYYLCVTGPISAIAPPDSHWQLMATATQFIATGQCVVSDNNVTKVGGTSNWDSSAYSILGYTTCHISCKTDVVSGGSNYFMVGFATNPSASPSYANGQYMWYGAAGTWQIYESGSPVASISTMSASDVVSVTYDGATVSYFLNRVNVRNVSAAGLTLYGFCSFYDPGSRLNSLSYGPTTNLAVEDTSQIGANAVTAVYTSGVGGPVNVYTSSGTLPQTLLTSISVPAIQSGASTVVITVTGTIDHHAPSAQFSSYAVITTSPLASGGVTVANQIARNANTVSPDAGGSFAVENTYLVPINTAMTFYLYGTSGGLSAPGSFANIYKVNMKAEVILK